MGNCQGCDNLDRKGDVTLEPIQEADRQYITAFEEIAEKCPQTVKDIYIRIGEFNFT